MSDIVNDYFKRFYPSDYTTAWKYEETGRRYIGTEKCSTIFPKIECSDGFALSVQGHYGAYSSPRDDFADSYRQVECMGAPMADELLAPYERECNGGDDWMVYPYVPVEVIVALIEKHGGLKVPKEPPK
jgi:hypothetical protein